VARGVGRRPKVAWIGTAAVLIILASFVLTLKASGISSSDSFTSRPMRCAGRTC